jgi:hypothetical protein
VLALLVGDCGFDVGVVDREFWFPISAATRRGERAHGSITTDRGQRGHPGVKLSQDRALDCLQRDTGIKISMAASIADSSLHEPMTLIAGLVGPVS